MRQPNEVVRWAQSAIDDLRVLGLQSWIKAEIYYSANQSLRWPPHGADEDEGMIPDSPYGYRRAITAARRRELTQDPGVEDSAHEAYAYVLVYRALAPADPGASDGYRFLVKRVWDNNRLNAAVPALGPLLTRRDVRRPPIPSPQQRGHAGETDPTKSVVYEIDLGESTARYVIELPGGGFRRLLRRLRG